MENKEKCLVTEAMDKCQCKWCKQMRGFREFSLRWIVQDEVRKIMDRVLNMKEET